LFLNPTFPSLRKKSWHPVLLSNQARVWEVEKKAVSKADYVANYQTRLAETLNPIPLDPLSTKRRKSSINSVKKSKKNDNC
jgi:hypothetical protein